MHVAEKQRHNSVGANLRPALAAAVLAALLLGPACSLFRVEQAPGAGMVRIAVPGEGWSVWFKGAPLKGQDHDRSGRGTIVRGVSGDVGVSLFVEPPANGRATHEDCYAFYWSGIRKNPLVDPKSVKVERTKDFVRLEYVIAAAQDEDRVRQINVSYYFAFRGRWADLHFAALEAKRKEKKFLSRVDESLRYAVDARSPRPRP